jgi:hypothetical protein
MVETSCESCNGSPPRSGQLERVVQRGRLISALFGGVVAGIAPQQKPVFLSLFLRVGGTALAAWNLAVFIEQERSQ